MTPLTPTFTLTVATSADAFIARAADDPPQAWASAEEQALFFGDVEAADWSIMGRNTHEAADKPYRRRIIFSSKTDSWMRPTQLWLNPANLAPKELAERVNHVRPLRNGLVLGGTRVHDWFLFHRAIDRVHLTVEPVIFGRGLPILSGQTLRDPVAVLAGKGFVIETERVLNSSGTRYLEMRPHAP